MSTMTWLLALAALIYFGAAYIPVWIDYLKAVQATEDLLRDSREGSANVEPMIQRFAQSLRDDFDAQLEDYEINVERGDGRPTRISYPLRIPVKFLVYGPDKTSVFDISVGGAKTADEH